MRWMILYCISRNPRRNRPRSTIRIDVSIHIIIFTCAWNIRQSSEIQEPSFSWKLPKWGKWMTSIWRSCVLQLIPLRFADFSEISHQLSPIPFHFTLWLQVAKIPAPSAGSRFQNAADEVTVLLNWFFYYIQRPNRTVSGEVLVLHSLQTAEST